jgi:hypothetical protein
MRRVELIQGAAFLVLALIWTAGAQQSGVTLYQERDFRGRNETFLGDDPLLDDNDVGRAARSIRVDPGCEVTLYERPYYQGGSTTLDSDRRDLGYGGFGGAISSLRVRCSGGGWQASAWQGGSGGGGGWQGSGWQGGSGGVTLYEDSGFRGRQETFVQDDPGLDDNPIGQDRASSVRVAPGCWVRLFEDSGYRGRYLDVSVDIPDLRSTPLGTDRASSLRVSCAGDWWGNFDDLGQRGRVTLYGDRDFRGRHESFVYDDPSLEDNLIDQDRASSVRVDPGCRVRLFEDSGYRGRYLDLRESVPDLRYTPLGGDSVSSLTVACDPARPNFLQGHGPTRGVTLYRDSGFRGRRETFVYDDATLEDNYLDHDTASSVRVDPGCRVRLYRDTGFRGQYLDTAQDIPDLRHTPVGTDNVSSLRVRCFRPPWER